jgi:trimethylamine--corrinoid protein Co-methyltransferase
MIISNYSDRQTPQFRVLSDRQCQEIFLATLECLERVGVIVDQEEGRSLLAGAGARIEGSRVFIPPHIIQDSLACTPRRFTLWGRDRGRELQISPDRVYFGPGPTCTYFYDPQTGERRKAGRGDAGLTAKVCDALENIDYVMSLSLFDDVTPMLSPVYEFAEMITNSGKPVLAWAYDTDTLSDIYQIAKAIAGSDEELRKRPVFAYFVTYESPLRHGEKQVANMIWAAERGIPIVLLGGPTVGIEAPITGASGLVIYLATALGGLAIAQLKRRGLPMVLGGVIASMDLRNARPAYGSPEMNLYVAAASDLGRYLSVPFMGTAGASESKQLDAQAAAEISIQILMSALSGAGLVHDVGFLDCADIGSLQLLVMSDEIIGQVKRILRGIEVNQQTIMMDLIEKVGPGGNFITERKSSSLCRSEIWVPQLMDRNPYAIWEKKGRKSMDERVNERLRNILYTHQPTPLTVEAVRTISTVLARAERRYA